MRIFILVLFSPFIIFGNSQDLETALKGSRTKDFPNYSISGRIISAHTLLNKPFKMNFKKNDQGLYADVKSSLSFSELQLDRNFNVLAASFNVFEKQIVEKINYNRRTANRNQYDEVVFNFFLEDKKIRQKGVYYTKNTLDTFSIIPVLQTLCKSDTAVFTADLGVQHMALKAPVKITKTTASDITIYFNNYTLPDVLQDYIKKTDQKFIVFTLKVSGWQGLLYSYRHYYVFKAQLPHDYVGHWGGADKTNLFSWVF